MLSFLCAHRESPDGEAGKWLLVVRVRDGEGAEWEDVDTTCGGCNFYYRIGFTPRIENIEPSAGEPCEAAANNLIYICVYTYIRTYSISTGYLWKDFHSRF